MNRAVRSSVVIGQRPVSGVISRNPLCDQYEAAVLQGPGNPPRAPIETKHDALVSREASPRQVRARSRGKCCPLIRRSLVSFLVQVARLLVAANSPDPERLVPTSPPFRPEPDKSTLECVCMSLPRRHDGRLGDGGKRNKCKQQRNKVREFPYTWTDNQVSRSRIALTGG